MNTNDFSIRHIGVTRPEEVNKMLGVIGVSSVDELIRKVMPEDILMDRDLDLPEPMTERELVEHIGQLGEKNEIFTSYIGQGWYDSVTPATIQRNVLENAGYYTSYTPYQAEISQGRLEALFNFQTVITELTGLGLTNCSLLDEATAGAEAASMLLHNRPRAKKNARKLFVAEDLFLSTLRVIETRATQWDVEVVVGKREDFAFDGDEYFGAIIQYTNDNGEVIDAKGFISKAKEAGIPVAVSCDLMSLVLLTPPGEMGADIVFGSAQRFGIPMYFGGPSAGFLSATESYVRIIPGRIVGISKDRLGHDGFRLTLQTREQHIKREKATSNICTAQALLATMSGFYAVYHGPEGLRDIAGRIHTYAVVLDRQLRKLGYKQANSLYFDTLKITGLTAEERKKIEEIALDCRVNFRYFDDNSVGISIDETTLQSDLSVLFYIFAEAKGITDVDTVALPETYEEVAGEVRRTSDFLTQEVFRKYHTETDIMRYMKWLERRDISLAQSMISLGSCTMKLNGAAELFILSNPHFAHIHPYAPSDQVEGYLEMLENLDRYLAEITGLDKTCFMPNAGAAGEYAGLLTIRSYLDANGGKDRDVVLLPASAHGTNPASAALAGFKTVIVESDEKGNIDMADFEKKANEYKDRLAATMITYPSTHGIFEVEIKKLFRVVHDLGGLCYMDGANMNAQVGWTNPGLIGADVCHLNLHKTFAIPHGGGGPGEGPIVVRDFLVPHLPSHPTHYGEDHNSIASAPFGSASICGISYAYIRLLGAKGLKQASSIAILNANYLAARLKDAYGITYTGFGGFVGHELILECRKIKQLSGIDETDIAKRLMDFNYHAPTLSFPVHGTLMIEPTESESLMELDQFTDVLLKIREEIEEVVSGKADKEDNVLKNAPHPQYEVAADEWNHPYGREKAAFALEYLRDNKFWVNVSRIDNAFGDRNLVVTYSCFG